MRPQFLTILCILTFIASAFGLYSSFSNYSNPETTSIQSKEMLDTYIERIEDDENQTPETLEMFTNIIDKIRPVFEVKNIKNNGISNILSNILTILGAALMWGLNKKGYWVYLLGIAVSVIAPIMIYGTNFLGMAIFVSMLVSSLLFCILYYLNIKHMS